MLLFVQFRNWFLNTASSFSGVIKKQNADLQLAGRGCAASNKFADRDRLHPYELKSPGAQKKNKIQSERIKGSTKTPRRQNTYIQTWQRCRRTKMLKCIKKV